MLTSMPSDQPELSKVSFEDGSPQRDKSHQETQANTSFKRKDRSRGRVNTNAKSRRWTSTGDRKSHLARLARLDKHLNQLEEYYQAIHSRRASVVNFLETKRLWQGSVDFRLLLQNASAFSATDPRDLVYAFMGLVDPKYAISG
jgi:hypothetical protein